MQPLLLVKVCVLLGVVVLFWVAGFDIIYSLQDFEFDQNEKLNSLPVLLGKPNALIASRFFHFLSVLAGGLGPPSL